VLKLTPAGHSRSTRETVHHAVKVFVYWNLHKRCWSLRAMEGAAKGQVIAHSDLVMLLSVTPRVSEAGRRRVIAEGVKNVHAGLVGFVDMSDPVGMSCDWEHSLPLAYNPRENYSFVYGLTGETFHGSHSAMLAAVNGRASVKV
jgi:hypothetical protein